VSARNHLAQFIRSRRERLSPSDVGLPGTGRRRTPGLRREELAILAGISVDYVIRLEQGREVNPSSEILAAIAAALRLSEDERTFMTGLSDADRHAKLCPKPTPLVKEVAPTVRQLLDSLGRTPAFVVGPACHVLAWNRAWQLIAGPIGLLAGPAPNMALHVFTDPVARSVYADWDAAADQQVSFLRVAEARWGDDHAFGDLLAALRGQPEFACRWSNQSITTRHRGPRTLNHPTIGPLRLSYEIMLLPDEEQRLISWLPAGTAAQASLDRAWTAAERLAAV
jgi:transcriptional regulator with XRE-family HTH domain